MSADPVGTVVAAFAGVRVLAVVGTEVGVGELGEELVVVPPGVVARIRSVRPHRRRIREFLLVAARDPLAVVVREPVVVEGVRELVRGGRIAVLVVGRTTDGRVVTEEVLLGDGGMPATGTAYVVPAAPASRAGLGVGAREIPEGAHLGHGDVLGHHHHGGAMRQQPLGRVRVPQHRLDPGPGFPACRWRGRDPVVQVDHQVRGRPGEFPGRQARAQRRDELLVPGQPAAVLPVQRVERPQPVRLRHPRQLGDQPVRIVRRGGHVRLVPPEFPHGVPDLAAPVLAPAQQPGHRGIAGATLQGEDPAR